MYDKEHHISLKTNNACLGLSIRITLKYFLKDRDTVQMVGGLAALPEDLVSIFFTHMAAHTHL